MKRPAISGRKGKATGGKRRERRAGGWGAGREREVTNRHWMGLPLALSLYPPS